MTDTKASARQQDVAERLLKTAIKRISDLENPRRTISLCEAGELAVWRVVRDELAAASSFPAEPAQYI